MSGAVTIYFPCAKTADMTERSIPSPPTQRSSNRLESLGRSSDRRKPAILQELTPQHRKLIDYMVNGCSDERLLHHIKRKVPIVENGVAIIKEVSPRTGEPLLLEEAADLARVRRRNARDLMQQPAFMRELSKAVDDLRRGHTAEAMHKTIEIMRDPGFGKAADRKVQLEAADRILAIDGPGSAKNGVNVNITNNMVVPGYVIDLRDPAETAPPTIEGRVITNDEDEGER